MMNLLYLLHIHISCLLIEHDMTFFTFCLKDLWDSYRSPFPSIFPSVLWRFCSLSHTFFISFQSKDQMFSQTVGSPVGLQLTVVRGKSNPGTPLFSTWPLFLCVSFILSHVLNCFAFPSLFSFSICLPPTLLIAPDLSCSQIGLGLSGTKPSSLFHYKSRNLTYIITLPSFFATFISPSEDCLSLGSFVPQSWDWKHVSQD